MTLHLPFPGSRPASLWRTCIVSIALALPGCSHPNTFNSSGRPERILASMRAACGGKAWDAVQGWHETGVVDLPGRSGMPHEIWHDMRTLKTAMMNRVEGRVMRHAGFNGTVYWQVKPDGGVDVGRDPAKLRRHRRDAYLSSSGWYFPKRFPAKTVLVESKPFEGTPHHVLRIFPSEAESFDLWVNATTYRIRRIVAGTEYAVLSDYKMFGGICSATIGRQGDGNPAHDIVLHVRTINTSKPIPASAFEPPVGS